MVRSNVNEFKVNMYTKLKKQEETTERKVQELSYGIDLLRRSEEKDLDYIDKLSNQLFTAREKLKNTKLQLDQMEKDLNGNSTLNPFLEKEVESEN